MSKTVDSMVNDIYTMCQNAYNSGKQDPTKQFVLTTDDILRWVNEGYLKFVGKARLYKKKYSITTALTPSPAPASYVLPSDLDCMMSIWYTPTGQTGWELKKVDDFKQGYAEALSSGSPTYYNDQFLDSNKAYLLTLYPAPTSAGNSIDIYGCFLPAALTMSDTIAYIPDQFMDVLFWYALSRAQLFCGVTPTSEKQTPFWMIQYADQKFDAGVTECRVNAEYSGQTHWQYQTYDETTDDNLETR